MQDPDPLFPPGKHSVKKQKKLAIGAAHQNLRQVPCSGPLDLYLTPVESKVPIWLPRRTLIAPEEYLPGSKMSMTNEPP